MFDEGSGGAPLQRVGGRAEVRIGATGLRDLYQSGSAKVLLPRTYSGSPEVVFLNTAGGVTGGDQLSFELCVPDGVAIATTQTAERAYRKGDNGAARVDISLEIGAGARAFWLPQETILYNGSALRRRTKADLSGSAELCLLDIFVFGRKAMGEVVETIDLDDKREVWRDGAPVLLDPTRVTTGDLGRPGSAALAKASAIAVLHLIAPDAEHRLARLRAVLPDDGSAAASAWDGRLSLRVMHEDPGLLRKTLARAIPCVTNEPLPRVWPR